VDDFGTGYSSLSYLKRFPVDVLKIDRSFVSDLPHDSDSASLVRTIIGMAHSLNLGLVAEGVETEDQVAFLTAEGCHMLQGYHFAQPMPVAELNIFLEKDAKVTAIY
jgi:EAL domain-containing protein (putative c-di-GMP-specific phosphodiesterase class I)